MSDAIYSVQVRIDGRVQGVGYRAWLAATAERYGLVGWCRNRRDGSVEALLAGPRADVEAVIEHCRSGPALARVTSLEVAEATAPEAPGFQVLATV
ncbi:MAG: acylphosphatase [Geminicoccaceae bacterium]|nr:MAG: acylphosphatase [Geminicoccaceae bacterium]